MKKKLAPKLILRCFRPFVHPDSRVLVLGSMPGPVALRRKQYYGFDGNHFWKIMPVLFGAPPLQSYGEKLALLKKHRVALWDVLQSCVRETALDSDIRLARPNRIPALLKKYSGIRAVFINGRTAYSIFQRHFDGEVRIPVFYLPSTSPAHAAMTFANKVKSWSKIKEYL